MGGVTHFIQAYLDQYGYPVLFFVVLVESFGIPAPGQTLLITGALLAATGQLHLWGVLLTVFAAAVIGDSIGWFLGRRGGRRLILRYGGWLGLNRHRFRRLTRHFERYGGWIVTIGRFIDVLRQINGLMAGIVKMPFARFVLFNALGAAMWVSAWGFAAYYLGRGLENWLGTIDVVVTWIFIVIFVGGFAFFLYRLTRWFWARHKRRTAVNDDAN